MAKKLEILRKNRRKEKLIAYKIILLYKKNLFDKIILEIIMNTKHN